MGFMVPQESTGLSVATFFEVLAALEYTVLILSFLSSLWHIRASGTWRGRLVNFHVAHFLYCVSYIFVHEIEAYGLWDFDYIECK